MGVSKSWAAIKALKDELTSGYNTILGTIRTEESYTALKDIDSFDIGDSRPDNTGRTRLRITPDRVGLDAATQLSVDSRLSVRITIFFGITESADVVTRHVLYYMDALVYFLVQNYNLSDTILMIEDQDGEYETGGDNQRRLITFRLVMKNEWRYC